MANQSDDSSPPAAPDLADLIAAWRAIQAQEQALAVQRAALQAEHQAAATRLAAYLRAELGAELGAELAAALAAPAPPEEPGGRGLGPAPFEFRGVNYYPAHAGWWRMWCNWNPDAVAAELDLAAALHATTIRTFLPFSLVGPGPLGQGSNPDCLPDTNTILDRVDQFLDLAAGRMMNVILGLFDESDRLPRLVQDPQSSLGYLQRVLNYKGRHGVRFGEDRRIALWDLVNEFDDTSKQSKDGKPLFLALPGPVESPDGMTWLRMIYKQVLALSTQDVTFAALNPDNAVYLVHHGFDDARHVPQYHEYTPLKDGGVAGYGAQVTPRLRRIFQKTGRLALIGECGVPSQFEQLGISYTPDSQRAATQALLNVVVQNRDALRGVLLWVLCDFAFPGTGENGEKYHGLYTADGQAKPAAAVVAQVFAQAG